MEDLIWEKDENQNFINLFNEIKQPIKEIVARAKKAKKGGKSISLKLYVPFRRPLKNSTGNTDFDSNLEIANIKGKDNYYYRGVKSNGAITTGQKIGEAKAFARVADKSEKAYCISCLLHEGTYTKCDTCLLVLFCSKDCKQKKAHQFECGTNFHCIEFGENLDVKLALQMVFESLVTYESSITELMQAVEELITAGEIDPSVPTEIKESKDRFKCIMKLWADSCDSSWEGKVYLAYKLIMEFPKIVELFPREDHKSFLWHLLAHFMKVIKLNSFKVKQESLTIEMIFDSMSFFNHHCSPNAFHFIVRDKMILISSRPIAKDQEVCICYDADFLSVNKNTKERRKILNDRWNFDCNCDRCRKGGDTSDDDSNVEITDQNLNTVRSSNILRTMEKIIDDKFKSGTAWTVEMGASCIAYFKLCMEQLNRNSK